jgi:RNA polymerase sigma-70 factor, ECF subfamily
MALTDLGENKELIEKLVDGVKDGDHEAFSKLYDIFADHVYKYVYYRVKSDDAQDIVEIVFLKIWENINKYNPKKGIFASWVFRIAHNLIIDHYRSFKDKEYEELKIDIPTYDREHNPIKSTEKALNNVYLKRAISKLKVAYRDIIVYKFINEFSNFEIAELMGKSEGSLRILQHRALKALQKEFKEMGIDYSVM